MNLFAAEALAGSDAVLFTETHGLKLAQASALRQCGVNTAAANLYAQAHEPAMALELCKNGAFDPPIESVMEELWRELKLSFTQTHLPQNTQRLQVLIQLIQLYADSDVEWDDDKQIPFKAEVGVLHVAS